MPTKLLQALDARSVLPEDRVVDLALAGRFVGEGDVNFICPHCRTRLMSAMPADSHFDAVFCCPSCRSYSRVGHDA